PSIPGVDAPGAERDALARDCRRLRARGPRPPSGWPASRGAEQPRRTPGEPLGPPPRLTAKSPRRGLPPATYPEPFPCRRLFPAHHIKMKEESDNYHSHEIDEAELCIYQVDATHSQDAPPWRPQSGKGPWRLSGPVLYRLSSHQAAF